MFKNRICFIFKLYVYVRVCAHECNCLCKPEEDVRSPGAGPGSCELLDMSAQLRNNDQGKWL